MTNDADNLDMMNDAHSAPKELLDIRQLYYFSVVAQELNLHRAAQRLFISQPPLSRHIKQLEERLGLTLFTRHTQGLTLTEDGAKVVAGVAQLLAAHDQVLQQLQAQSKTQARRIAVGFTTGFDQGLFTAIEAQLRRHYGTALHTVRLSSLRLVRGVKKGKLALAFVALPLETQGLTAIPLGYAEGYVAALPEHGPEAQKERVSLHELQGTPVFWFRREANPAFYDYTHSVFTQMNFSPIFLEEPAEHDVLLARVAAGEATALLPASFAVVHRQGVVYRPLAEADQLQVRLGVITAGGREDMLTEVLEMVRSVAPCA